LRRWHQALAPQQRRADLREVVQRHPALGRGDDLHPLVHLVDRAVVGAEQRGQPGLQRPDVRAEQPAGVQVRQQVLHGDQGVDLRSVEPQPGQFVLATAALRLGVAVAAGLAVPDDRRVQPVAQVFQVALDRGPGHLQLLQEVAESHQPALAEQLVDLVEALGAVHDGGLPRLTG
jgi:hypothetical protein